MKLSVSQKGVEFLKEIQNEQQQPIKPKKQENESEDSKEKDTLNVSRLLSPSSTKAGSRRRSYFGFQPPAKKNTQITLF